MDSNRLQQQFAFILEADKEKNILRQTRLSDGTTHENDADHAWHMALMCILLSEYANEKIDVLHTVSMILIHDVVEIDAGDTYAYDAQGNSTRREREEKAADRLYSLLPDDQRDKLRALWEEFEEGKTPEARFARTLDNVQPAMLNNATDGIEWVNHGVRLSQILCRNKNTADGSAVLWDYAYRHFIEPNVEKGRIIAD
jgi:putative hydrolase of HD superfamily